MNMIAIALVTMVAGFVQTVTGFGAGIVNMLILPLFLGINVSAGISGMVTLFPVSYTHLTLPTKA